MRKDVNRIEPWLSMDFIDRETRLRGIDQHQAHVEDLGLMARWMVLAALIASILWVL